MNTGDNNTSYVYTIDSNAYYVIIAGGRTFNNYKLLKAKLDILLSQKANVVIVSGTAKGADKLGEQYAQEHNLGLVQIPADWTIGKSAGYIRNVKMANITNAVVVFWDGKSSESKHMIDISKSKDLPIRIIRY